MEDQLQFSLFEEEQIDLVVETREYTERVVGRDLLLMLLSSILETPKDSRLAGHK